MGYYYEHFFSNNYGDNITMYTFFSNKCCLLLIEGAINLLILSAMIAEFTGASLRAHAQMSLIQSDTSQAFNAFCSFYYKKSRDRNAQQNTQVCQQLSYGFSSLLKQDSPNGYTRWPIQASLRTLAQKGLLMDSQNLTRVKTPQAFVNTTRTNLDLQALVSGSGNINKNIPEDPAFLPALWDYNYAIIDQPISPTCTNISLSYYYSDTWPFVGPKLLQETSQELTHTIGIPKIYNELQANGHCSLAALSENVYRMASTNNAYQLEKHILARVQSQLQGSQIHNVSPGLAWIMSQTNQMLVDDWVSFAMLTNPKPLVPDNNNLPSSSSQFNNKDYQNALDVFCNIFQRDVTSYLYGSVTPAHLHTMVSDLRDSAGDSVSALALGMGAGVIPRTVTPDIFEKKVLQTAQQTIDTNPGAITQCPGTESLSQAKPALDDFVTHKMATLNITDIDSFFSQAVLFDSQNL